MNVESHKLKPKVGHTSRLESLLRVIAGAVALGIFLRCFIDIDDSYDTWTYHLPFAAKLWNIVPESVYLSEPHEQARYKGFPILVQFFQGMFWFVTQRVQAANLVGWSSVIVFSWFLRATFAVPLYLSVLTLFGIPLVQSHATSCYVDLPANIGISVLVMMVYRLFTWQGLPTRAQLFTIVTAAAFAANSKPQLIPLTFAILCAIAIRLLWVYTAGLRSGQIPPKWVAPACLIATVAGLLIFATPIKNTILYRNPFYPVRIEIAGQVLNHEMPLYNAAPPQLESLPRPQRWAISVLEIDSAPWSVDQWSEDDPADNRMGGFNGVYVIFNLVLLTIAIARDRSRETLTAAAVAVGMSAIASIMPQSHELRYYIFWMVSLISLNLIAICRLARSPDPLKTLKPEWMGLVGVAAVITVAIGTNFIYIRPNFFHLDAFRNHALREDVIARFEPDADICLVGFQPYSFVYSAQFHPELDFDYSLAATGSVEGCGDRQLIIAKDRLPPPS
ncbi:MAG: hypothetical protein AAF974_06085 [Cyanobacteria bacterium P01_E01_bin.34]